MSKDFKLNGEGYLVDSSQWGENWINFCWEKSKKDVNAFLSRDHLNIVYIVRDYYLKHDVVPTMVQVARVTNMNLKQLYEMFDDDIMLIFKLAGCPGYITTAVKAA